MHKLVVAILGLALSLVSSYSLAQEQKPVGITPDIMSVTLNIDGMQLDVMRNQDNNATVNPAFAKTSRPCPPFCIQPSTLAVGVETIGEVELIDYAKQMNMGDEDIIVIDSRTPDWVARGTVPTAMNVPWTSLNPAKGATPLEIAEILEDVFNVTESEGLFDFSNCRTAVLFLQRHVVRAIAKQYQKFASTRLSGAQDQMVSRRYARLGNSRFDNNQAKRLIPI